MSDAEQLFDEIKQESVETRNVVIKSDNLVKNLSVDIRNLQKQLAHYQGKNRWFIYFGYAIIIIILAVTAYLVVVSQNDAANRHLEEKNKEFSKLEEQYRDLQEEFTRFKAKTKRATSARENSENLALEILDLLDQKKERDAVLKSRMLDISQLSALGKPTLQHRLGAAKRRQAEATYRSGRVSFDRKAYAKAIPDFELALELDPDASFSSAAMYYLTLSYANNQDKQRALQSFENFFKKYPSNSLSDDMLYYKATNCEKWEMYECSASAWQDLLANFSSSSYTNLARKKIKVIQTLIGSKTENE